MKTIFNFLFLMFCFTQLAVAKWNGFGEPFHYSTTRNYYVLLKDINNDSFPDIVTANVYTQNADNFGIRLNDKTGHFQDEILIPVISGYTVWDFADLNNDGLTDFLTSYYWDNGIRIYMGSALTSFTHGPLVSTAVHGWLSKISDTDGDGILDLINISHGSGNPMRLHIFKGNGDGTFLPKATYESQFSSAHSLLIKDINEDGLKDIILSASFTKIPVFLQNPDNTFSPTEIPIEHGESFSNAVGDINNDGIEDIVYGPGEFPEVGFTDTIRITLGMGDGLFKSPYTSPGLSSIHNPIYVRVADLNHDKNQDIITLDLFTKDLYYFLGNGDSTFEPPIKLTNRDTINNFEIGDINQDGFEDIVTINRNFTTSVFLNNGETTNIVEYSNENMLKYFPNPFSKNINIDLALPESSQVSIEILDVFGNSIEELVNTYLIGQNYRFQWQSNNPSGIYFLKFRVNENQEIYKLLKN